MAEEPLGDRLRRLREARGMSRADLAEAVVGLSRRTDRAEIIRYEDGLYLPRLPTFAALARVLGVSMETLWYGEEEAESLAWERERVGGE